MLTSLLLPSFFATSVQGVHSLELFELDGNVLGNDGPGPDWADIFDSSGAVVDLFGGLAATFLTDDVSTASALDKTTFSGAGGSNKNNDPISDADCAARIPPLTGPECDTWHWDSGNVPGKDDFTRGYTYATSNPANGHLIIYSGFERRVSDGDSHIDIEFTQSTIGLDKTPPCGDDLTAGSTDGKPCEWTGIRTIGDLIVSMDFTMGGGLGTVSVHEWNGVDYCSPAGAAGCPAIETLTAPAVCTADDFICGLNNAVPIPNGPWAPGTLEMNKFTEFGVDVTGILESTPCITEVNGHTRSSQSFTAELKDFAGPFPFAVCKGNISITPDDVNEVNEPHTFFVHVTQSVAGTVTDVTTGHVSFTLTSSNGAVPVLDAAASTCDDPGDNLDSTGQCTIVFTSATAGLVTGHAAADFILQGAAIHVETDGSPGNTGDAVKRFVDAFITIAPDAVNMVTVPHTFDVTVKVNRSDGAGFVNAPDETIVDVTLTAANGAVIIPIGDTCSDPGTIGGVCGVTFTSNTAGTVTGHASASFTLVEDGVSVPLTRETDGNAPNSGDAVKRFVDAFITIVPDDVNEVGEPHTFDVTVKVAEGFMPAPPGDPVFENAPDGTPVTVTLTNANGAVNTISENTCATTGTTAGTCSVTFTSDTAGTVTGHASVLLSMDGVTLILATDSTGQNSGTSLKRFIDAFITIEPDEVNAVGEPHTFDVTVKVNFGDDQGFINAPDGTPVTVTLTEANGAVPEDITDTCGPVPPAPGTVGGMCTVTFTSQTAGTVTGHASTTITLTFTLPQGDVSVALTRETDGMGLNSGPAVKRFVDAFITITPAFAENLVGTPHTFTVTVMQDSGDGIGFVPVPDNTIVTVTLTDTDGAAHVLTGTGDTCATPGTVNGQCTVTFTSNDAGTVTGTAEVTLKVQGASLTRSTDGVAPNSGPAVKVFIPVTPNLFTLVSPSTIQVGHSATDTATITGLVNPTGTGTITFTVYTTKTDDVCSDPVFTSGSTPEFVTENGDYVSNPFTPSLTGTYYWIADFTGDRNNNPVSTQCGDSGEVLTVFPAHPRIETSVSPSTISFGQSAVDTATIIGLVNPIGDGAISFAVYFNDPTCTSIPVFTSGSTPEFVTENGDYVSNPFTPSSTGTYYWTASFSGDRNNQPFLTECGASGEILIVSSVPKITAFGYTNTPTNDDPTLGSGMVVYTFTIHNYGTSDVTLSGALTVSGTATVTCTDGNTLTLSDTLAAGADMTFMLTCSYSGNSGDTVQATLNAMFTDLNGVLGNVSGSPATTSFTIQTTT